MSEFILVRHEAKKRGVHYDLRFEIPNSKLWASFSLNEMPPTQPNKRIYIPRTNDHSRETALYTGKIPEGEYGAGIIKKIDGGDCEIVKYRNSHIIVDFKGKILKGKYHFINVGTYDKKRNYKKKVYGFFKAKDIKQLNEKQENLNEGTILTAVGAISPILLELWIFTLRHMFTKKFIDNLDKEYDKKFSNKLSEITGEEVIIYKVYKNDVNAFTLAKKDDYTFYYYTGLKKMINLTDKEIIAILLHEFGHCKENHGPITNRKLFINSMLMAIVSGIIYNAPIAHFTENPLLMIYSLLANFLFFGGYAKGKTNRSLRWTESDADQYPVKYGYKKEFLSALIKMKKYVYKEVCKGISESECDKKMEEMFYWDIHPSLKDRIDTISKSLTKIFNLTLSFVKTGNILGGINFLKGIVKLQKNLKK
jgi:hypothetical protein